MRGRILFLASLVSSLLKASYCSGNFTSTTETTTTTPQGASGKYRFVEYPFVHVAPSNLGISRTPLENFTQVGETRVLLVKDMLSYSDAKAMCERMNSTLVEFWNEEEWTRVRILAWPAFFSTSGEMCSMREYAHVEYAFQIISWLNEKHHSKRNCWIGLNDLEIENSFKWESGRDLSEEVETHWADDQPNNQDGRDHCVQVFKDPSDSFGMWDTVCDRPLFSMCQKRPLGKEFILIKYFI